MIDLVHRCLRLSRKSYKEETLSVSDVEAYVDDKAAKYSYLAFRGTEASKFISGHGWWDVVRDLRTLPWYDSRVGWSHAGFLKGARHVVGLLVTDYGLTKDKPVIVTGHSLGGALAVNAAALLHAEGYTVHRVITFGAPRTFKWRTATKWAKVLDIDNFSNHGDPVCDVPTSWLGWRHVNEVKTSRDPDGYGFDNHVLPAYFDAFKI